MGKPSRDKGKRGELEVAKLLEPLYPHARRGAAQSRKGDDAADVEGTPYWVEVKRVKRNEAPRAALRQATADADGRPPVVFSRCNGEEWMVTMRAEDWRDMAHWQTLALELLHRECERLLLDHAEHYPGIRCPGCKATGICCGWLDGHRATVITCIDDCGWASTRETGGVI